MLMCVISVSMNPGHWRGDVIYLRIKITGESIYEDGGQSIVTFNACSMILNSFQFSLVKVSVPADSSETQLTSFSDLSK